MPDFDPRLLKVLQDGGQDDDLLEVVVRFAMPEPARAPAANLQERRQHIAEAASQVIQGALEQAGRVTGTTPRTVSTFPSLGSALVRADRPFMKVLLDQEGIVGAVLNSNPPK
jgi:hypothetical protein